MKPKRPSVSLRGCRDASLGLLRLIRREHAAAASLVIGTTIKNQEPQRIMVIVLDGDGCVLGNIQGAFGHDLVSVGHLSDYEDADLQHDAVNQVARCLRHDWDLWLKQKGA